MRKFVLLGLGVAGLTLLAGCASSGLDGLIAQGNAVDTKPLRVDDPEIAGRKLVTLPRHGTARGLVGASTLVADGTRGLTAPAPVAPAPQVEPRAGPEAPAAPAGADATLSTAAAGSGPLATRDNLFDVVSVLWGTDRKIPAAVAAPAATTSQITTGSVPKTLLPNQERGDTLTLGRALVTIPKVAREKGQILRPRQFTFWNYSLSLSEDPARHFTLGRFEKLDPFQFGAAADAVLADAKRFEGHAFVYVHGYNSTFEQALYRTAQLAHDLEFDGAPFMYSWPSWGSESGYLYDQDSADRAQKYFLQFLETVATRTKAKKIHIIAHSMGTRPLLDSLKTVAASARKSRKLKIDQIVLAAPDIDRDVFVGIAGAIGKVAKGATLYAMQNDRALQVSRTVRGVPRAGDVPPTGPVVVSGVDTIDISDAAAESYFSLNHSNYAERPHVLADISALLRTGQRPPHSRFPAYQATTVEAGTYWKYQRN